MAMKKSPKQGADLLKASMAVEQPFALVADPTTKYEHLAPKTNGGTPAAQVIKGLIQKRLDTMTFLELALTLAHVMEKKG